VDTLAPFIALTLFVIVVVLSQIVEVKYKPQELSDEQENAVHAQNKLIKFAMLMFLFVSAVNFLIARALPGEYMLNGQISWFFCFPTAVITLMLISVSSIKYRINVWRGRGQRDYPTGGYAVVLGVLGLVVAFGLVFGLAALVIFFL
jgi:hypothetical protein